MWDFKTSKLLPHDPQWYISGLLPFNFVEIDRSSSLQTLCPRLCAWIVDRANKEEVYINILIGFLLLAVLDVRNPERFLFLSGYSATGKSTYLKLLQRLVPSNKAYVSTSETISFEIISSNFGLQDFTGISKTLLICHDIGSTVSSAFVNLLRNLVSSGESQNVQRKFERVAKMQFEGVVALASNKNPFTQQQREGIIDRRMAYVPFTNRVKTKSIQDFDTLFPPKELAYFASFAVQQDISLIVRFIRTVNEHYMVRQVLLESFKENPKSLHLQNFITRRTTFCNNMWVPLGAPEDTENFQNGVSIYCAYLRYVHELGVPSRDIVNYTNFRQEFLPLLNRLQPQWEVFERRRLHPITGKRVFGLLNLQSTAQNSDEGQNNEKDSLNLELFRETPFWVRPSSDQTSDGRLLKLKNLLMKVPPAIEPEVLISPSLDIIQHLFQSNPVIALDTEFSRENPAHLAYIQIEFLHSHTVCILTYNTAFAKFVETFWSWLKGDVALIGFYILVDLDIIWRHFGDLLGGSETLLYKVFDLYSFLKFVHNGYKHQNSLADWSKRLVGFDLEKQYQKTDWFNTVLDTNLQKYLRNDVWVLHHLLNYVQQISHLYYYNSWSGQKHYYFETSYQLDQVLIPCFLDISLQGITISSENLDQTHRGNDIQKKNLLKELGLTESQYRSSKQFTEFIEHTTHLISNLTSKWPRTNSGFLNKSQKSLSAWLTQHTADPLFQKPEIVQ